MAEMSGSSNEIQVDDFSDHEEDSDFCMSDEVDDDNWDGFDVIRDQNNNVEISSEYSNVEELTETLSETELAEEPTAATTFTNFLMLPEEIQLCIWKACANSVRRTIVMKLGQNSFFSLLILQHQHSCMHATGLESMAWKSSRQLTGMDLISTIHTPITGFTLRQPYQ